MAAGDREAFFNACTYPKRGPHEFSRNAAAPSAAQRSHPFAGPRNAPFDAWLLCIRCLSAPATNVRNPIGSMPGVAQQSVGHVGRGMPRSRATRDSGNYLVWNPGEERPARQRGLRRGRRRAARRRSGSQGQSELAGHDRRVFMRIHRPRALRHRRKRGSEERSDAGIAGRGSAFPRARRSGYRRALGHDGWASRRNSQSARRRRV